jgi:hypothetical protein
MKTLETQIPFPGFYNSIYDSGFDSDIEYAIENYCDENPESVESDVVNAFWDSVDTSRARLEIAELHVETWCSTFTAVTGIDLGLKFKAIESPREYNFTSDSVYASVSRKAVFECYKLAKADGFTRFRAAVKERFTSRSGFISFYPSDYKMWINKPLVDWDCNEIETLIVAALGDADGFQNDLEWDVYEYASGNGMFACVDYSKAEESLR